MSDKETNQVARRVGARTMAEVPQDIRKALNAGKIPSANLVEMLVIDFGKLAGSAMPDLPRQPLRQIEALSGAGIVERMNKTAAILYEYGGAKLTGRLSEHTSDMVRGWAAYMTALRDDLALKQKLEAIRPFADDENSGVREWAWMAVRPHVKAELEQAFRILQRWTEADSANVRRFASEITRPRGVWTCHIEALKLDPSPGLPLLSALKADPSRYVQNSVANWLNDASKSHPEWVRKVCEEWAGDLDNVSAKNTWYIVKRATRSGV